ncbi:hypothetical protein FRC10_004976 [Ceratobasidium sp. 414]|nr:hypothetical protein FRC10_004976 [Ceratobasidium sp. 414]
MSNNIANPDAPNLPYYVATFQGRSVAIKRDADYQNTIKLVQKSIAKLRCVDAQDILISTALTDYGGSVVQISEEIWPDVVGDVRTVEITLDDPTDAGHPASGRVNDEGQDVAPTQPDESAVTVATVEPPTEHPYSRAAPQQAVHDPTDRLIDPSETISITIRTASQALLKLGDLRSSSTIGNVKSLIETTYNVPAVLQRLDLLGITLVNTKTLGQYDITDWTILDLHLNARQSMIFFWPDPNIQNSGRFLHKDVEVTLSLNRSWELATLRPSGEAPIKDYAQSVSWTVDVAYYELLDHSSNAELSHLFWDGMVPTLLVIPRLNEKTHAHIALRFVTQTDRDEIASLSISPPTDCITRILVLYKGLSAVAAQHWDNARPRYTVNAEVWKETLGAKSDLYGNSWPGIRVLEVSWMEVC